MCFIVGIKGFLGAISLFQTNLSKSQTLSQKPPIWLKNLSCKAKDKVKTKLNLKEFQLLWIFKNCIKESVLAPGSQMPPTVITNIGFQKISRVINVFLAEKSNISGEKENQNVLILWNTIKKPL